MKLQNVLVQLGNPSDTDGAKLTEGYLVPIKKSDFGPLSDWGVESCADDKFSVIIVRYEDIYTFAWDCRKIGGPDFPEAEYYSCMVRGQEGSDYDLTSNEFRALSKYLDEDGVKILPEYRNLEILKTKKS